MKPQRDIRPAGIAASHSDALFGQRAEAADPLPEFGRLGERLARALPAVLAAFGGKGLEVRAGAPERLSGAELADRIGPLAANCLFGFGAGEHRLLLSIDARALLAQLDRAFGGSGEIGRDLPTALPLSADLLAQRVEQGVASEIAKALDAAEPLETIERDGSYAALEPFAAGDRLVVLTFEVIDGRAKPWPLVLAARADDLGAILPPSDARRRAPRRRQAGPLDAPFADITLEVEAVLTEMRVPLSRIATLAPGQTLPIPVARAVPLRIGGAVIARGTVGELEDRVALQLTQALLSRKDPA